MFVFLLKNITGGHRPLPNPNPNLRPEGGFAVCFGKSEKHVRTTSKIEMLLVLYDYDER